MQFQVLKRISFPKSNVLPVIVGAIILGASGCAGSVSQLSGADAGDLQRAELFDLCFTYVVWQRQHSGIREELQRREVFSTKEWKAIDAQRIFLGMSESALLCSWGRTYEDDLIIRELKTSESLRKSYAYLEYDSANTLLNVGIFLGGGSSFDSPINNSTGMWEVPGEWPKLVYVEDGVVNGYVEGEAALRTECLAHQFEFTSDCLKYDHIDSNRDSPALLLD